MGDFRVPLDAVYRLVRVAHRLDATDVRGRGPLEARRDLLDLVGVAGPHARFGVQRAQKRVVVVENLDCHVRVAAVLTAADPAAEFVGDELHPQTDAQHGHVEVEVRGAVPDVVHVRAPGEDDAVGVDVFGRRRVVPERDVDAHVPERALLQVRELSVVVDNVDSGHY